MAARVSALSGATTDSAEHCCWALISAARSCSRGSVRSASEQSSAQNAGSVDGGGGTSAAAPPAPLASAAARSAARAHASLESAWFEGRD